jgi:hypothetical protein
MTEPDAVTPAVIGSPALARALGLSFRRLDLWIRAGYLRPSGAGNGTGSRRTWPATEQAVAAIMLRLTAAGLTTRTAPRRSHAAPSMKRRRRITPRSATACI